jgi:hypothetical protein
MSAHDVDRVGRRVLHDRDFRARLLAEPAAALAEHELADEERAALLAGDVGALYHRGAHEYLLMNLARFGVLGLDAPTFSARMRAAGPRAE